MTNAKTLLLIFIFAVSVAYCRSNEDKFKAITGKVIKIRDGDTIEILHEGKPLAIRLAHIDCPEKKQPFGNVAKQFTSTLCFGQMVTVQNENEFDRYGRMIGVIINNTNDTVNLELVRAGFAWHYKKYSKDKLYSETEIKARVKKIGLWADPKPIPPWDWR